MDDETTHMHVLEEIRELPLALDRPLYRNYPGMKLGQPHQVEFFSRRLAALVVDILEDRGIRDDAPWVLTAPPYCRLPAAANLMAEQVHRIVRERGLRVAPAELRLRPRDHRMSGESEFRTYLDYSKNGLQQRIRERERVQDMLDTDGLPQTFAGRRVIVINDINVTGTQQRFLRRTLDEAQATSCDWVYIFSVEATLAAAHPEIEHAINNSQIHDLDGFAAVLDDASTRHTARCISRLLSEEAGRFRYLIDHIDPRTSEKLYQLAQAEGRYSGALFAEKMALLAGPSRVAST